MNKAVRIDSIEGGEVSIIDLLLSIIESLIDADAFANAACIIQLFCNGVSEEGEKGGVGGGCGRDNLSRRSSDFNQHDGSTQLFVYALTSKTYLLQ